MFSRDAITALQSARSITVLTGAGVSAESGVPTFRGAGGLWRNFKATDLATPEAFERDPKLVWEFYNYRREMLAPLQPNPGHHAIAAIEARAEDFTLITQNIDNLHRIAGSKILIELHGNIWRVRCANSGCENAAPRENRDVPVSPIPLLCGECGGFMRPHIVWFGEMLNSEDIKSSLGAIEACDFFIVAGTSAVVQPAAGMPLLARRVGAFVLEINPERTDLSEALNESVQAASGEALPLLIEAAFGG
ncbi:MAG: NAD-dependent deacylase [Nitrospinaceae bacterium]|jgi:NAD-dependent deacetylase|nr:NAD-dependent deacylase [Nitrospinaceae bacterium]MBT3434073.1 NAD-dependent deacylase [Nitrospinaceae bacterium]MBT4095136.1 NAD-dependent deacylase [Nitrospinaceae bacterium]MBT4429432.1 NAD-dependent deacylase [Nitrospinaceae bacterium]MBT5367701.1 NAD-dependent deacylase [Nitrospinaceae bacterium]